MNGKKTLESDAVNHENKVGIQHTMTNSTSKQHQLQQQQYSNRPHSSRKVYTNAYLYVEQQRTVI